MSGLWAAAALLAVTANAPGCGSNVQALCEEIADCRDGNEQDIEACVAASEPTEALVDDLGCREEYDAFYDCFLDKGSCESQSFGGGCTSDEECSPGSCENSECVYKDYQLESDDCEAEQRAFSRCFDLD